MGKKGSILVGTSGWHYAHWKGPFYPKGFKASEFLKFYAERFRTVEINNSFYRLPEIKTFSDWKDSVQEDFVFAVKASRYITHMKKLKDPVESLDRFLERIAALGAKLGPALFQLPPRWRVDLERLSAFVKALPTDRLRVAFEFRDKTWQNRDVYEILNKAGAALCVFDMEGQVSSAELTANFAYVRLHGPGDSYHGQYDERALAAWAETFAGWSGKGLDVYCYFDNDEAGHAAQDALRLAAMCETA